MSRLEACFRDGVVEDSFVRLLDVGFATHQAMVALTRLGAEKGEAGGEGRHARKHGPARDDPDRHGPDPFVGARREVVGGRCHVNGFYLSRALERRGRGIG